MPTLTFKVSEDEAVAIRCAAREKRLNLSAYLRDAAVPDTERTPAKVIMKRHPLSGGWYNAAPGQPEYTLDELKEALADFP